LPLAEWLQSPQAPGSGSPYQVHQYGFYMVVSSVSYCGSVSPDRICNLSQEGIAHLTCCLFQGKALSGLIGLDITLLYGSRDVQLPGKVSDILSITFGLGTT